MSGSFSDPRMKAILETAGTVAAIDSIRAGNLSVNSSRLLASGISEGVNQYAFKPYVVSKLPNLGNPMLDKVFVDAVGYGASASVLNMVQGRNADLMGTVIDGALIAVAKQVLAQVISL